MTYDKPLTRVRESVAAIRALLAEGTATYQGELVRMQSFDLWFEPLRNTLPIYLSAVFPKMTALCGEIADGVILTRSTLATSDAVRPIIADAAQQAGRVSAAIEITSLLPCAVAAQREEAMERMRPGLALYAGFFPRYNKLLASHGFEDQAAAIRSAWDQGDRAGAIAAVSDDAIDATSIAGPPEHCRERLQAYRDSGIDLPIISPFARGPEAKRRFMEAIEACAPA